ncbi:hypothetical protein ABC970_22125 [Bacillus licheniformis]|uniref:hypothetical protein n=1 Tax=Bacillus TaxID=1386 RepID=UPI00046F81D3|nr:MULTISPECIES: hypothetical protein [Bacillus]ASK26201.1 hypothetical protein BSSX_p0010 [Bacillus subtilis]MCA1183041.1 hypothetical protein [Bacillus licheniformis]MCQ5304481.1 hypothetical protein [Bacillus licheniformis]MDM5287362.1 hypothetical protein [Bacillus licheniformis]MEC0776999.1 hypothetical protein [Bacillus licheniformis]
MDGLISSVSNILHLIQKPAIVLACIMFAVSGYCFMFMGQNGTKIGKTILVSTGIALLLIYGANALVTSFKGSISF